MTHCGVCQVLNVVLYTFTISLLCVLQLPAMNNLQTELKVYFEDENTGQYSSAYYLPIVPNMTAAEICEWTVSTTIPIFTPPPPSFYTFHLLSFRLPSPFFLNLSLSPSFYIISPPSLCTPLPHLSFSSLLLPQHHLTSLSLSLSLSSLSLSVHTLTPPISPLSLHPLHPSPRLSPSPPSIHHPTSPSPPSTPSPHPISLLSSLPR